MFLSLTRFFCKTAECPTSGALLAYSSSLVAAEIRTFIEDHLASCDFCGAELQLLTKFDGGNEEHSFAEMPEHLRRLAEALLKIDPLPFVRSAELAEPHRVSH